MSVVVDEIDYRFSIPGTTAGNRDPQTNPADSRGGYASTTVWLGGVLHDLFGPITGDQNAAMAVDYRCLFVCNKNSSLAWTSVKFWITHQATGGAEVAVGVDPTPATPLNHAGTQAVVIATVSTPPSGVVFSAPADKASGLDLGDLGAGFCRAVWVRRAAQDNAAVTTDSCSVRVEGETV
jgi:hypothetical protein